MELKEQILAKMIERAATLYGKAAEEFSEATKFTEDLAVKSVDLVKIITAVEEEFDIEINFMDFRRKKTFGEAAAYVETLCEG